MSQISRQRAFLHLPSPIRVPPVILTFHGVGPVPRQIDPGERECWLEADSFETVLDAVRKHSHVQLTVDDGNVSDLEIILPALVRRKMHATFFICSGRLDTPTFLGRHDIATLREYGMDIGSHGIAHVSWRNLPLSELSNELFESRRELERLLGSTIDTAACPFGAYDRTVLNALRRAGYRRIYTSDGGNSKANCWLQSRTTVTRSTSLCDLERFVQQGAGLGKQALIDARRLIKRLR